MTALWMMPTGASAFTAASVGPLRPSVSAVAATRSTSTRLYFFGEPKDDGKPGDYVCKVRIY